MCQCRAAVSLAAGNIGFVRDHHPCMVRTGSPLQTTPTGGTRTRLVRAAIADAARALFLERGYAATTMQAISEESGIPPATVY